MAGTAAGALRSVANRHPDAFRNRPIRVPRRPAASTGDWRFEFSAHATRAGCVENAGENSRFASDGEVSGGPKVTEAVLGAEISPQRHVASVSARDGSTGERRQVGAVVTVPVMPWRSSTRSDMPPSAANTGSGRFTSHVHIAPAGTNSATLSRNWLLPRGSRASIRRPAVDHSANPPRLNPEGIPSRDSVTAATRARLANPPNQASREDVLRARPTPHAARAESTRRTDSAINASPAVTAETSRPTEPNWPKNIAAWYEVAKPLGIDGRLQRLPPVAVRR